MPMASGLDAAIAGNAVDAHTALLAGANIEAANSHGWTVLLLAAINRHAELVSIFLHAGANMEAARRHSC
jgi:ankyrin repeat protein